jgi:hypothetical protein
LTKLLNALEEDVEVVEVSEVHELVEEGQLNVIIVMRKDISLDIVLFRNDLGVPTVEKNPPRIALNLSRSWKTMLGSEVALLNLNVFAMK